jgi:hypothetical protein
MEERSEFLEFTNELKGFRVFRTRYRNGFKNEHEVPKYVLFWSKISVKEIYNNPQYRIAIR